MRVSVEGGDVEKSMPTKTYQRLINAPDMRSSELLTSGENISRAYTRLFSEASGQDNKTAFVEAFEVFISEVAALYSLIEKPSKVDAESELKSFEELQKDFDREMERLRRHGSEFSLTLISMEGIKEKEIYEELFNCLVSNMRAFDEVYSLPGKGVMFSLKQTDRNGALKFIKRSQNSFDKISQQKYGKVAGFNSIIATPIPGEKLGDLVNDMTNDLKKCDQEEVNEIVFRKEISPLQKYLQSEEGN
tara:strand:- start:978 stop:1718 length:741 start_codon:yes stop_codon:yes gene_type:complete